MLWPCHADMLMCLQTNQGIPCFLSCKKHWNISLESQLCSDEQATSAQSSLGCRKTTRQPYRCIVVALDAFWRVIHNCLHDSFTSTLHKQTRSWCSHFFVCLRCCNWNCLEEVYTKYLLDPLMSHQVGGLVRHPSPQQMSWYFWLCWWNTIQIIQIWLCLKIMDTQKNEIV